MAKKKLNETQTIILTLLAGLVIFWFYQGEQLQVAYVIEDCRTIPSGCTVLYWDNQTEAAQLNYGKYACTMNCETAPEPEELHPSTYLEPTTPPATTTSAEAEGKVNIDGAWYEKVTEFDYKVWYADNKFLAWALMAIAGLILLSWFFKPAPRQ